MKAPYFYSRYIIDMSRVVAVCRSYNAINFTLDTGNVVVWKFDDNIGSKEIFSVYDGVRNCIDKLYHQDRQRENNHADVQI